MNMLNYSDDTSDNEEEFSVVSGHEDKSNESMDDENVAVAGVLSRWATADNSSDEDEFSHDGIVETNNKAPTISAEQLLADITDAPNFLSPHLQNKFEVKPLVNHTYNAETDQKIPKFVVPVKDPSAPKPKLISREKFLSEKAKNTTSALDDELLSKLSESSKIQQDKLSGKDRVKRQRLSGQSGIGADFKEWKSEEAMRQRQQYD